MLAFFQSPLIIEFAATTPVIQGIFTIDINLSYLAYIRTILANEGSKFVSLVPQALRGLGTECVKSRPRAHEAQRRHEECAFLRIAPLRLPLSFSPRSAR